MKILFRITIVIAVIILCLVGGKIGYYRYNNRDGYSAVTVANGNITATATRIYETMPPATTLPATETDAIKAPPSVTPPIEYILFTAENNIGTPKGSTIEIPDLKNSVFVGDSVSLGFSRHMARKGLMSDTVFLTAGSYSVRNAMSLNMNENKGFNHPLYKGKEAPLLNTLEEIKPDNIYFCLGINDIAVTGVEGTVKNYCKLINEVWKASPNATVYIVSTTFMVDAAQKTNLNNLNLANLNHNMKKLCEEYDKLEYIDIMSSLQDEKFALSGSYCSDGFIHQSNTAYEIWAEKLGAK